MFLTDYVIGKLFRDGQLTYSHFFLDRLGPLSGKPVLVHMILPVTENCPS